MKCVNMFCTVCVFRSTSSARFPLCQSVAAMEHPGLAQPSISRLPWLSAHARANTLRSEKTKATRYFIKRLQLLFMWARSKKDFLSQDSTQKTGRAASSFSQFRCLSYSADSTLGGDKFFSVSRVHRTSILHLRNAKDCIPIGKGFKKLTTKVSTTLWPTTPSCISQENYKYNIKLTYSGVR